MGLNPSGRIPSRDDSVIRPPIGVASEEVGFAVCVVPRMKSAVDIHCRLAGSESFSLPTLTDWPGIVRVMVWRAFGQPSPHAADTDLTEPIFCAR
jgi:hypothetical protein